MDKQRSTKHTHKTKDRVTRPQLKTGGKKNQYTTYTGLISLNPRILLIKTSKMSRFQL